MTLHLTRIVRRYTDHSEPARKAMTARLANEIAEGAKSRELVADNDRVKRRRFERTPGWWIA